MCVNRRLIYNRFVRRSMMVDCGKCPACLQKKAAYRANRIRNAIGSGQIGLFVTLTYRNEFIPYVFLEDLERQVSVLNIYRECQVRYSRYSKKYLTKKKYVRSYALLDSVFVTYPDSSDRFRHLNGRSRQVGVIYYKDIQDFFKRLRQNLIRNFNYDTQERGLQFFICSELGPSTFRPHFHLLIVIEPQFEAVFRAAILKSWPYADSWETKRNIEVARDVSTYISSYVNCDADIPKFFKSGPFRPKHSYSQGFGLENSAFSLPSICEKIDSGDFSYVRRIKRDGNFEYVNVPIPQYVISRYFPRFKGFTRLPPDTLVDALRNPRMLCEPRWREYFDVTDKEIVALSTWISHCKRLYDSIMIPFGRNLFYEDYSRVWSVRSSYILKHSFDEIESVRDYGFHYDNLNDFLTKKVDNYTLAQLFNSGQIMVFEENPNNLPYVVAETQRLTDLYGRLVKRRKVNNVAMSDIGYHV